MEGSRRERIGVVTRGVLGGVRMLWRGDWSGWGEAVRRLLMISTEVDVNGWFGV